MNAPDLRWPASAVPAAHLPATDCLEALYGFKTVKTVVLRHG
jgi:hypothetical protein